MALAKTVVFRVLALCIMLTALAALLLTAQSVSATTVLILCDGKTFDGYTKPPFRFLRRRAADPMVRKIIRNCTFKNSNVPGILLNNADNVLIVGNTFYNIRTYTAGEGVHAINASCNTKCANIVVRGNTFQAIGADGIQIGDMGRNVTNFFIVRNTFIGTAGIGENAIDIKGAQGPIHIRRNIIKGFRPCLSPSKGGTQDCSGSPGEGIVLHQGKQAGAPGSVTVAGNTFENNIFGLSVSRTLPNIIVRNNTFKWNKEIGLLVSEAADIHIETNNFLSNPKHIAVQDTDPCTLVDNTFTDGIPLVQKNANCSQ